MKIELNAVFGKKCSGKILEDRGISLTLCENHIITRTNYLYEELNDEEDILSGYKTSLCNEKSYIKKEFISHIGVGFDEKYEVYFIKISSVGLDAYVNVESADKGNEVLNQLISWWL